MNERPWHPKKEMNINRGMTSLMIDTKDHDHEKWRKKIRRNQVRFFFMAVPLRPLPPFDKNCRFLFPALILLLYRLMTSTGGNVTYVKLS